MRPPRNRGYGRRARRMIAAAMSLLASTACGGSNGITDPIDESHQGPPTPIVVITVLDGDRQTVPAGERLPQPVRVSVRVNGQPGSSVEFRFIDPATPDGWKSEGVADSDGIVLLQPEVGNIPGTFTMAIFYTMWISGGNRPTLGAPSFPFGRNAELGTVTVTGTIVSAD